MAAERLYESQNPAASALQSATNDMGKGIIKKIPPQRTCVPKISHLTALSTPFWPAPPLYALNGDLAGLMTLVSA